MIRQACIIFTFLIFTFNGARASIVECKKVLENYETLEPRETWDYDWTSAIFLYGALTFTDKYPQSKWSDENRNGIFAELLKDAPEVTTPDLASVSLPAMKSKGSAALLIRKRTQAYLATEPLNVIGAFDHVGHRHKFAWFLPQTSLFSPSALWADSIIMYVLNGYELALADKNVLGQKFYLDQVLLFEKYLLDQTTQLYKHAYFTGDKVVYPQSDFWARGNLWIDLALVELLEKVPKSDPHYELFLRMLTTHLEALKKVSTSDGLHTLLLDKNSYTETTATALLAYVLKKSIRLKLIDPSHSGWAQEMVKASLNKVEDHSLTGISGPTTAFKWPFYYKYIVRPQSDTSYGVGAFLLMCSEL